MTECIYDKLIKLSIKASNKGEVPVAAIVVKNGIIVSEAFNNRERKQSVLGHAEVIAIKRANKKIKNWNLSDCDIFVTLKPCKMCEEIIKQSRINNVYYLLDNLDYKKSYNGTNFKKISDEELEENYHEILSTFFQNLREKK